MKRDESLSPKEPSSAPKQAGRVRRFTMTERMFHWSFALPQIVLMLTGGWFLAFSSRSGESLVEARMIMFHKIAGMCFMLLPLSVFMSGNTGDILKNIRLALSWNRDDLRWLYRSLVKVVFPSTKTPEMGKFNPGQKLNMLLVMTLGPTFAVTGLIMWVFKMVLLARIIHAALFFIAVCMVLGHIYMAIAHPSTRPSFWAIVTGDADREWALHHHSEWVKNLDETNASQNEG